MKYGENARDREKQARIDKVASGTDTPTETKGGGQQWIVTEGPIGIEEALRLKRKRFRICNGIMKHTPEEDDGQNNRRASDLTCIPCVCDYYCTYIG
jgi:hypothetical protein